MTKNDLSLVQNFRRAPDYHWHLGVVAKRTYVIDANRCRVATEQVRLFGPEDEHEGGQSFRDKDTYGWKPCTDVVIHGSVFSGGAAVRSLVASVEIGALRREVRVYGERQIEMAAGLQAIFSRPVPFESMPLVYERSYGGFDAFAAESMGDAIAETTVSILGADMADASCFTYPRNSRGIGFYVAVDPKRVIGTALPNLEDPEDPLDENRFFCESWETWAEQPIPGALDWILPSDFPRCVHFHLVPERIQSRGVLREITLGALETADLESSDLISPPGPRAAIGGPPGLSRVRLVGDEIVRLGHMHPKLREMVFRLPGDRPELFIKPPGCPVLPLEAALDTVYIEPNKERFSLVWSGSLRVAARYPPAELAAVEHEVKWT